MSDILRSVTVSVNDDGTVRAIRGEVWRVVGEGESKIERPMGTRTDLTVDELAAILPNADLAAQVTALQAEKQVLEDAKTAVEAERDALREQVRAAKGVPQFRARDLVKQFTEADNAAIAAALVQSPDIAALYTKLNQRGDNEPIPLDSETFQQGLAGLTQTLGEERVAELFSTLSIDIATMSYIEPLTVTS